MRKSEKKLSFREKAIIQRKFRENSDRIQRKIQPNHIIPTKPHNSLQEKLHGHFIECLNQLNMRPATR